MVLFWPFALCSYRTKKLTYEERKAALEKRLNALNAGGDEDDE